MSILCMIGLHRWSSCRCLRCFKVRSTHHEFRDNYCVRCKTALPGYVVAAETPEDRWASALWRGPAVAVPAKVNVPEFFAQPELPSPFPDDETFAQSLDKSAAEFAGREDNPLVAANAAEAKQTLLALHWLIALGHHPDKQTQGSGAHYWNDNWRRYVHDRSRMPYGTLVREAFDH